MLRATASPRPSSSTPRSAPEGGKSSYVPATGVKVELGDSGYVVRNPTGTISLASEDAAGGNWNRFERGAVRSTPFGSESVVVTSTRAEQFLTVRERQGERTWRWRLGTGKLKPKLRVDGSVLVTAGADSAGLRIAPVAILDGNGRDVTPAKASWKLDRSGGEWFLALDLDDAKLPLPYAIDPAVDYPATQYLRSTASTTQTAVPDYALADDGRHGEHDRRDDHDGHGHRVPPVPTADDAVGNKGRPVARTPQRSRLDRRPGRGGGAERHRHPRGQLDVQRAHRRERHLDGRADEHGLRASGR